MKTFFKKLTKTIPLPLMLTFALITPFYLTFGCPIRFFTGISCLGCGMSRAALALLKCDFRLAFEMHPMIFLMPPTAIVIFLRKKLPKKLTAVFFTVVSALMIITYVYRLANGNDVIRFAPENGYIYRLIKSIFIN